jgi:membrane-associated phospholipid phosphatase
VSGRTEKLVVSIGVQTITAGLFVAVQRLHGAGDVPVPAWLVSPVDARLPFVPASVWLYASWYVAPAMLFTAARAEFRRAAAAIVVAFVVCAVGWVLIPATMDRPRLDGMAGASAAALRLVYLIDPPRNLFPSFHAALAGVIALLPGVRRRLARATVVAWMGAICVSCVLTKQHYLLDVLAGLVVGLSAATLAAVVGDYLARRRASVERGPRRQNVAAAPSRNAPTAATHSSPEPSTPGA